MDSIKVSFTGLDTDTNSDHKIDEIEISLSKYLRKWRNLVYSDLYKYSPEYAQFLSSIGFTDIKFENGEYSGIRDGYYMTNLILKELKHVSASEADVTLDVQFDNVELVLDNPIPPIDKVGTFMKFGIIQHLKTLEGLGFSNIKFNEDETFDATRFDGIRFTGINFKPMETEDNSMKFELGFTGAKNEGPDIAGARKVMWDAFEADPEPGGFKHGYISNIAMLLHDQYGITDYETRNKAAEDILKLIFD